jgi:hypothetical protein
VKIEKGNQVNAYAVTPAQVSFISNLLTQREYAGVVDFEALTKAEASRLIEVLKSAPRKGLVPAVAQRVVGEALRVGMYRTQDGEMYRVHESRETGRLYAKHLNVLEFKFEYAQGAIYRLTPSDRMSLEEACAFGVQTGFCCVCGKFLTDPDSVARGIGPVCARGF